MDDIGTGDNWIHSHEIAASLQPDNGNSNQQNPVLGTYYSWIRIGYRTHCRYQ